MAKELTCVSYISGKHSEEIEINTTYGYVSIYDFYCEGHEAEAVINEINLIYNSNDCTALEACEKWACNNLG